MPKLWIDLANSPHVPLFLPIVRRLQTHGVDVTITARDFAQTRGLAEYLGLSVELQGGHGGRSTTGKGLAVVRRALELREVGRRIRPALALSHNSYALCIAARSIGVPCVTLMDYEHTPANHLSFRLARTVVLPDAISPRAVRRYGATRRKIVHYPGYKEQIYLSGFEPDPSTVGSILPAAAWENRVVVVARPPADFALYHRFENPLFEDWLSRTGARPDVRVVVLPRVASQHERIAGLALPSVVLPDEVVDGANLIYHADLVVSAGGTMNREAAVLGVPAYSFFAGRLAAVDRRLAALGRITLIRTRDDLSRIRLEKKTRPGLLGDSQPLEAIVAIVLSQLDAAR